MGDDTTKQATTLSYLALRAFPKELQWLEEDFDGRFDQAFDELVRYVSPVISFARTATRATELGGHLIAEGDKVALFYCSGNRDESIFGEPHLGSDWIRTFGGTGLRLSTVIVGRGQPGSQPQMSGYKGERPRIQPHRHLELKPSRGHAMSVEAPTRRTGGRPPRRRGRRHTRTAR
jgi:hypothetical protein